MTSRTHDDGFHEIQLSGKQLVFLFMAASVVAGVVFLLGVFVGRGVRVERGTIAQAAALSEVPVPDAVRTPVAPVEAAPTTTDPTVAAPPTPVDDLTYFERLDKDVKDLKNADKVGRSAPAVAENVTPSKASPEKAPATPAVAATPAPTPAPAVPVASGTSATLPSASGAPGDGYAVQVAALNARSEADAIVKRLASKGYAAYVQVPSGGGGSVFRVRVGMFKSKREAETVAARLQKEERITPWVTR